MKERIQERGHCQACGRLQAANPELANHGYTVEHGYFHGTCPGARKPALEVDRSILDEQMAGLLAWAASLEDRALKIEQREELPLTYQEEKFEGWVGRKAKYTMVIKLYADLDDYSRNHKYNALACNLRNQAKGGRDHAAMMYALADQVHGQPLVQVKVNDQSKVINVGDQVKIWGRVVEVTKIADAVARGCGPYLNGNHMPHVFWMEDGKELKAPKRSARKVMP